MGLWADTERLEGRILGSMERQRNNGEAVRCCVSIADVRAALKSEREAAVHAWAQDFHRRHCLSVSLLGGGRMLFSPAETGAGGKEEDGACG
jgi:hypothetical protein